MARSIWKGSISFGLVNIPVGLYSAEKSKELHFNLLDRRNLAPIHYQRVNSETGKEVRWEDTVRGYEFEPHRYVVLSDEDLKRANPESTQTVEILDFVDLAEISPVYFEKPYFLAPERNGAKSYALLRETLRRTGKAGIAKVVIRTRQYLAAVVPTDDALVLDLMRFQDELRDTSELDLPSGKQGVSEQELKMAERLVEAMVNSWDPERYRDDYRTDVKALIESRVAAGQLEAGAAEPAPQRQPARGKVVDLMSLLKRSVEAGGRKTAPAGGARTRTAAPGRAATPARPAKTAKTARLAAPSGRARKPPVGRGKASSSHRRGAKRSA
jgi:DNA end-binding protein Ku